MRTLEQVLLSKGFTQAELDAPEMTVALKNPRFRKNMEEEFAAADVALAENARARKDLDEYDRWYTNEITPDYLRMQKEREDAVANEAAAKARLAISQKRLMERQAGQQSPEALASARAEEERIANEAAATARAAGQPGPKYVDEATFQTAFERTGEAIASGITLARQHEKLFGSDLDMDELYKQARAAKMPVKAFWEQKYKVQDKRDEIAAKATADNEARIRADERQKFALEMGTGSNPNIRSAMPSNNPFVVRKSGEGVNGKQPWEIPENERTQTRIGKAFQKAVTRGEV
ncbi:MAG: hypothetical protein ACREJN_11465 [Nitrospiraceae bacterium]